ncbi:MAG: hypothetical protein H8D45_31625 [Bacteroidetes bacterium]|nr:hypothetical protein [Bacteroidota bacterium]MBL7104250.1 hypothetical protein [Bacteroidales bacterium]
MDENQKKTIPLITKIFVVINILLFGITGTIFFINGENLIGYILLAAGFSNIIWALFSFRSKNLFFVILNFIFAAVALVVGINYQFADNKYMAMMWIAIMLVYLIIGFVLLLKIKKDKSGSQA